MAAREGWLSEEYDTFEVPWLERNDVDFGNIDIIKRRTSKAKDRSLDSLPCDH